MVRPDLRHAARIRNRDERGQVLALAPDRVTDPRAHARETIEGEAGGHLVFGGTVRVRLRRHGMDEAKVVRQSRKVRQHVREHFAGLAARFECPVWSCKVPVLALKGDQFVAAGQRLAVALDELGLVVPCIDMAQRARRENHQNVLGFGGESRPPRFFGEQ